MYNKLYKAICLVVCVFLLTGFATDTAVAVLDPDADSDSVKTEEMAVLDPVSQSVSYSAVVYNNTNGLPTSEANAIVQTAEGAIWIGSYGGFFCSLSLIGIISFDNQLIVHTLYGGISATQPFGKSLCKKAELRSNKGVIHTCRADDADKPFCSVAGIIARDDYA